jgi:exosome complex component RRP43
LSPLCSPQFSIGRATDHSVRLGEWLTNHIISTKLFSLDELCIADKQSVWVIYADIVCIDYDGNVLDAALLALVHALKQRTYYCLDHPFN